MGGLLVFVGAAFILLAVFVLLMRAQSADRAAEALLRELLTDAEYRQLRTTGYLEVASPSQLGRIYRVPRRRGRVLVYENGSYREMLCVQPAAAAFDLPDADVVILHKLLIQADEEFYLQTANHFRDPEWWSLRLTGGIGPGGVWTAP